MKIYSHYLKKNQNVWLTDKQLQMHGCPLSTVATDDLVKHQGISIHSADLMFMVFMVYKMVKPWPWCRRRMDEILFEVIEQILVLVVSSGNATP